MRIIISVVIVITLIWLSPLFLSDEFGLRLGLPYRVFFTLFTLFAGFLFYLLRSPAMSPFKSTKTALGIVVLVFGASVGFIVLLSAVSPQFTFESKATATVTPAERGKAVYDDPNMGCFLCHAINKTGGTRGPDLSHIASVAGERRQGMSTEGYLKESLLNPGEYVVPSYDNIMPPVAQRLSAEQLDDLIAYLSSLK
ncbi:MAG: cytochrome c [Dehalococcoidales bacterium]|nr:cytochrome c [Dehalococcoidales bacterium]